MAQILKPSRRLLVGPASFAVAIAVALAGALITGTEIGAVTGQVEWFSATSGNFLGQISNLFPLGFAFSAGMVSSVNPCGFVMLPAYLGLYLGDREGVAMDRHVVLRIQRAVFVGLAVTAGFVLMFAVMGMPIGLGARGLARAFPWIGLFVGVLLAGGGAYLLSGGKLYTNVAARASARMSTAPPGSFRGYFTFGIAYGVASLSCTLPVFLAVVGGTSTASTFLDSLLQFVLYAFGMGAVILFLTLAMAVFRGAVTANVKRVLPYASTASALLLLISGAFIVYYWLTIGGLLEQTPFAA